MLLNDNYRAPERRLDDVYETPHWLIEAALDLIGPKRWGASPIVLDVGAGDGRWGKAVRARWSDAALMGVEIRPRLYTPAYDGWLEMFFPECKLECEGHGPYDLIGFNPPYRNVEAIIRAGWDLLAPAGVMLFLLPLRFLASQSRRDGLFRTHPPKSVTVCSKRPSFQADGKTNATDFGLFLWSRCWGGTPALKWLKETNGT